MFLDHPSQTEHKPVMLNEVIVALGPVQKPTNYLDGTFGRGGHSFELSQKFPGLKIYAVDKDHKAIDFAHSHWKQKIQEKSFFIQQISFSKLDELVKTRNWPPTYDMILLDLGVSSPQLDQGQRGFSFYKDGPLDMRMDQRNPLTAEEIINHWSEDELVRIFKDYGEVKRPQNTVRRILRERKKRTIASTLELSRLIENSVGWKKRGKHPATRYFLALRLVVNRELEDLGKGLEVLTLSLNPGGRLVVISFHSLEDRIVKRFFKGSSQGRMINKKVIVPGRKEQMENKRSRGAKLRIFEKDVYTDCV